MSVLQRAGGGRMIEYPIGSSGQTLVFESAPLAHLVAHRQLHFWQAEAGGQLFARFNGARIVVQRATGPRRTDLRTRHSFSSDAKLDQREIEELFAEGLHFVGDWHSHPEDVPSPSGLDTASIAECVRKSAHSLNGFLLVVVGRASPPRGLYVAVSDGHSAYQLTPSGVPATRRPRKRRVLL